MTDIREIANWFHEREGELFTEDKTPFNREEIVQVINDSVDPVQQVQVDGERYYGVISYEEHDGWYEYTRWDDAAGEVNMGVCAKCVQEVSSADAVARTIGDDTDTSQEKFQQHYDESHSVRPNEVKTGATLLSGTTINSNEAIHLGNDGAGSGIDADLVRGSGSPVKKGQTVAGSKSGPGTVQSQFASPSSGQTGVGLDSSDCLWHADLNADSIYELNQTGTVQSGFASPSSFPKGVGLDSSDCLWHADANADSIYELNQTGTVQSQFSSPSGLPIGVGLDSSDCLWHADRSADSIYELNQTGTIQSQFASPSASPQGVGLDSSDCLWHADSSANSIYELNQTGTIQSKFSSPSSFPTGVGLDSSDCIWHADGSADSIYELSKSNTLNL